MGRKWTDSSVETGTSVAAGDLILTVSDPSGTPVSKKITVQNLMDSESVREAIRDHLGDVVIQGGANVTVTHDDPSDTITVAVTSLDNAPVGATTPSTGSFTVNTVDQLIFDIAAAIESNAAGEMSWDVDAETVMLALNDNIHMHVGQDSLYHALNQTGSDIAKGTAVYATGTVGNSGKITIAPFTADGTYDSKYFMGVTAEAITNGSTGFVVHFGKIRQINTNAFEEGDILYADPSTAGGLTNVRPAAPNNIITVAIVVTKSATVGELFVRPTFVDGFADNEDVTITSATTNDILAYNGSVWVNTNSLSLGGTLGVTGAATFSSTVQAAGYTSTGLSYYRNALILGPSGTERGRVTWGSVSDQTNTPQLLGASGNGSYLTSNGSSAQFLGIKSSGIAESSGSFVVNSTLTLASGSITDSSGSISFGNENLSTTGKILVGAGSAVGSEVFTVGGTQVINAGADGDVLLQVLGADAASEWIGLGVQTGWGVLTAGGIGATANGLRIKIANAGSETTAYEISSTGNHNFQSGSITTTGTLASGAATLSGLLSLPSGLGSTLITNSNNIFNVGRQASSGYPSISYASEVDGTSPDTWVSTTASNVQRSALVVGETVEIWHAASQTTAVGLDVGLTKRFEIDGAGASITGTLDVSSTATVTNGELTVNVTAGNPTIQFQDSGVDEWQLYYDTGGSRFVVSENGVGGRFTIADGVSGAIGLTGNTSITGTLGVSTVSGSSAAATFKGYESILGTTSATAGEILIGETVAYQGRISYTGSTTVLYLTNTWNNANGDVVLRTAASTNTLVAKGYGSVHFRDGSTSYPSIAFQGDTDTGIYRGAANTLTIATGGANALTLDSSQNATFAGDVTHEGNVTFGELGADRKWETRRTGGDTISAEHSATNWYLWNGSVALVNFTTATGNATFAGDVTTKGSSSFGGLEVNQASGGHVHRFSGASIQAPDTSYYGTYGTLILHSSTAYTSSSRRYMITNAYDTNKFAIIRSSGALTDPALGSQGATASGSVADFVLDNAGDATFAGDVTVSPSSGPASFYITSVDDNAYININSNTDGLGGEDSGLRLRDNGSEKWSIRKDSSNDLNIYNWVAGATWLSVVDTTNAWQINGDGTLTGNLTLSAGNLTVNGQATIQSASDSPLSVYSTDGTTGIRFDDPDGSAYLFYRGNTNTLYSSSIANFVLGASSTANNAQLYSTQTASGNSTYRSVYGVIDHDTAGASAITIAGYFNSNHTHATGTSLQGQGGHFLFEQNGAGTTTYAMGLQVDINANAGTISNAYGVYINAFTATGTITNRWGIYQAGASENNYLAGDLRIGTTSAGPNAENLVVDSGASGIAGYFDSGVTQRTLVLHTDDTTNGKQLVLHDAGSSGYATSMIGSKSDSLLFYTGSGGAEAMRVDTSGRLLIGTTSATSHGQEVLRVASSGSKIAAALAATDGNGIYLQFANTDTGTTASDGFVLGIGGSEEVSLRNYESTPIIAYTANTERLRIASNAYAIGIGTTNVKSWASTYAAVDFGNSAIMGSVTQTSALNILHGAYYDGAYKHTNTGTKASAINMNDGNVIFRSAGTGTADGSLQGTGSWSETVRITDGGMLLVGDTANTDMTVGLTINQGTNDDQILALKSSDVNHGISSLMETDTFGSFKKASASSGGLVMRGLTESSAAIIIQGYATTEDTTKATTGVSGAIEIRGLTKSGVGAGAMGASANLFAIKNNTTTTLISDSDGDLWISGGFDVQGTVVLMSSLPTADPVNAGQLWNDSGTVKVSAG